MMTAEIITVGDELLIGQVINTNQAYIAERLNAIGVDVTRMTTIGDTMERILASFHEAWKRTDIVIVTGGLGPTHDDITRNAVCTFFDSDLVPNETVRAHIEELLKKRNIGWRPAYEDQTLVPAKAVIIPNPIGTAPGLLFEEREKRFIVLPGVPYEMKEMIDRTVIPGLATNAQQNVIEHLTIRTTGIPESILAQKLGDLESILQGASLAFLPSTTGVRMRVTVRSKERAIAKERLSEIESRIVQKVGKYVFGTGDEELEAVVGRLLTERQLTIALAESCTGGAIADKITNISGSSLYFERGIVAYSDQSKTQLLGVPEKMLTTHGAVSKQVAEAMAVGVRKISGTNIGLSTTGIAGPTGGSPEKQVGLVWIGYADELGTTALRFNFGDFRVRTKERAAQAALEIIRRKLLQIE